MEILPFLFRRPHAPLFPRQPITFVADRAARHTHFLGRQRHNDDDVNDDVTKKTQIGGRRGRDAKGNFGGKVGAAAEEDKEPIIAGVGEGNEG